MGIKLIPLSQLEADIEGTLTECLDSGEAAVVELSDHRLVPIRRLKPGDDDALVDELLAESAAFRALVERSRASERVPFPVRTDA
jgi:hypothetical protein